jgi:hypothetical protein
MSTTATPAPVTIPHTIQAQAIEVVPADLVARVETALAEASALTITDAGTYERANVLAVQLHALDKALSDHGETVKRPLAALVKTVRECLDRAAVPVTDAKRALQGRIVAWKREEDRKAAEIRLAAEKAAREAKDAAEAERARLQAAADAKHAADLAAARATAEAEAKELADVLGAPVEPAPVVATPAPVVAYVAPAAPLVPKAAPLAAAVTTRQVPKLEITDATLVPATLGGIELRPIDMAAVKRALAAGLQVPGARMIMVEEIAMGRGK